MTKDNTPDAKRLSAETLLTRSGRDPESQHGFVNTPVTRGSTVLFATLDALEAGDQPYRYGRTGNPNSHSVEAVVTELEQAAGTRLAPSGLSAISTAILSCVSSGDEILVTDSAYEPTRAFCDGVLKRLGVSTRFYDPRIGSEIADLVAENTRAIFVESPGSLTFEVQDLPGIVSAAKDRELAVIVDNTWATPLFHRPIEMGADLVVHAGTKMFVGHSDAMFGTISANARLWPALARTHRQLGVCASPDDCFLAARGLRTLAIRMKEHQERALEVARWLETQEGVARVLHPGLASHPDHELFKRDFGGSGSLFSVLLPHGPREALAAMVDGLELFGMGYSWGGYESLVLPGYPNRIRTAVPWTEHGQLLRLHIGLESVEDLKADLASGLKRYLARL